LKENRELFEKNKTLINNVNLLSEKNEKDEKKSDFYKKIYHDQIILEREKREKDIKDKEKGIENILANYSTISQQNKNYEKLVYKLKNKYEFVIEEFLKNYEKHNFNNKK